MEEEKEVIEQEFRIALDNIVSKIKGQTATAIVCGEQPMILLFRKLIFKLEELEKENKELKSVVDKMAKRIKEDTEWFYSDLDNKTETEIKNIFMEE